MLTFKQTQYKVNRYYIALYYLSAYLFFPYFSWQSKLLIVDLGCLFLLDAGGMYKNKMVFHIWEIDCECKKTIGFLTGDSRSGE